MNDFKTVFAEISYEDKEKLNSIIKIFKITFSDVKIEEVEFQKLDRNYLVSFNISEKYYSKIIEKFTLNKIKIITSEKEDEEVIAFANSRMQKKDVRAFDGWDTQVNINKPKRGLPVKQLIAEGDYLEIIKIINDVNYDPGEREAAKIGLPKALENAIKNAYSEAINNPRALEESVSKLIDIASNGFVNSQKLENIFQNAMSICFDLIKTNKKFYNLFINIGNNKDLPDIYNIKAILEFTNLTFYDKKEFIQNIKYAFRYSNLKYIVSIYDNVKEKLTINEKKLLKDFLNYINQNRTQV